MNPFTFRNLLNRKIGLPCRSLIRQLNFEGDFAQTRLNMVSQEDDAVIYIDAFSSHGFRLNNQMRIYGPCAVFPRSVLHWGVASAMQINEESLSLFCLLEPKLDILVLGVGDKDTECDRTAITKYLLSKKINVEILSTENACAVFNFLNSERRFVAAGLLPPQHYLIPDKDTMYVDQREEMDLSLDSDYSEKRATYLSDDFSEDELGEKKGSKGKKNEKN